MRVRGGCSAIGTAMRVAVLMVLVPAAGRAESLQDAWNAALAANPALQAAQAGTAAARRGTLAARAERVPTLTTVNAYTWLDNTPTFRGSMPIPGSAQPLSVSLPFLNREFFLSSTLATVPLYTGGRIFAGIDSADAQARATRADEIVAALDLKLEVAQAYLNVLRAEKLLRLARSTVTSLQSHERDVTNLVREGVARRTDLLASQVSLARARQKVIQASNELETARAAYNRLLGRPLTTPAPLEEMALQSGFRLDAEGSEAGPHRDGLPEALPGGSAPRDPAAASTTPGPEQEAELERLTETALGAGRPELLGLSSQAEALAAQARVAESIKKPQVGVVGGFTYISDTHLANQDYWSGTIGATWLLCDGGRAGRRAEALRLREGQTLRRRQDTATRIALNVRASWLSLQSSSAALDVARRAIGQADENLREVRNRYGEQVSTNTEVLDAETLRTQTYTDYYNSFYAVLLDRFRLERAVGCL